jgi:DNA-directed RNA polymerase I, II, and III subunit RPABC2
MSSYFDTVYGGDEDDEKIVGSDDEKSESSSVVSDEENMDGEIDKDEEEVDLQLEDDEEDDDDDDEDINEDEPDDEESMKGGANDEEDEIEDEIEEGDIDNKSKRVKKIPSKTIYKKPNLVSEDDEDEDEDEDDDGEMYLQKFDRSVSSNYVVDNHPESVLQNYDEILAMSKVIRDKNGIIIDDLHKTIPYLTKYERARILGQRAKQINAGAPPFIKVPENVIDGYIIAEMELREKKIPFIIRRPLPNGGSEYWSIKDLEDIAF